MTIRMSHPYHNGKPVLVGNTLRYLPRPGADKKTEAREGIVFSVAATRMGDIRIGVVGDGTIITSDLILQNTPAPPPPPVHFWYEWKGDGQVLCDYMEDPPDGEIRCVTLGPAYVTCRDCREGLG